MNTIRLSQEQTIELMLTDKTVIRVDGETCRVELSKYKGE